MRVQSLFGASLRAGSGVGAIIGPAGRARWGRLGGAVVAAVLVAVVLAGSASSAGVTFSCQLTSPARCYGPAQIRAAYGVDQLSTAGAGQTIVVIEPFQSPTISQDLTTFDTIFGLPATTLQIVAPDGLTPFDQSDSSQTSFAGVLTSQVEWAHAIAPAATIELVLAKSDAAADILSAEQFAVARQPGNVIVEPASGAESCLDSTVAAAEHANNVAAAGKGITVLAPTGDTGAAQQSCDGSSFVKGVSASAADPLVTSVGGTALVADGQTGAYQSESVWNEPDFAVAGGGGFSTVYATPSYQQPLGLASRGVPDVSWNAQLVGGELVVWSTSGQGANLVFQEGGTELAAAQWGGLVALAAALAGHGLGSINPTLYRIARDPTAYASDFHDITVGDNTFHGPVTISGFAAATGWDAASGLGSPNAANLVPALVGADLSLTNTAPATVVSGRSLTYTVAVTNQGAEAATAVTVTDSLPDSAHFDSLSTTQGSCTRTATGAPKTKGGVVLCSVGTLGAGATVTITIVVTATTPVELSATASVTASNVTADADDTVTAKTSVKGT
jgi:uncharacterized repeat protein (TIGR01451 family)